MVLLGSVWAAVFSKEVFLPIALLPTLVAFGAPRGRFGAGTRWSLALAGLVPAGVLVAAVAPPLIAGTGAAYGSRSDVPRTSATFEGIFQVLFTHWAPAALVAGSSVALFAISQWRSQRRLALTIVASYAVSLLLFGFDALIYYGTYELPRYGLNWQLLKVVWIAGAAALAVALMARPRGWWPTVPVSDLLECSGSLLVLGIAGAPQRLESLQVASATNVLQTRLFQDQMEAVRRALGAKPSINVAIIFDQLTDYEPVRAVSQDLGGFTQGAVVAVVNPSSASLDVLRNMDLPASRVAAPEELGAGQWACAYLRSGAVAIDGCPVDLSFVVEAWAM